MAPVWWGQPFCIATLLLWTRAGLPRVHAHHAGALDADIVTDLWSVRVASVSLRQRFACTTLYEYMNLDRCILHPSTKEHQNLFLLLNLLASLMNSCFCLRDELAVFTLDMHDLMSWPHMMLDVTEKITWRDSQKRNSGWWASKHLLTEPVLQRELKFGETNAQPLSAWFLLPHTVCPDSTTPFELSSSCQNLHPLSAASNSHSCSLNQSSQEIVIWVVYRMVCRNEMEVRLYKLVTHRSGPELSSGFLPCTLATSWHRWRLRLRTYILSFKCGPEELQVVCGLQGWALHGWKHVLVEPSFPTWCSLRALVLPQLHTARHCLQFENEFLGWRCGMMRPWLDPAVRFSCSLTYAQCTIAAVAARWDCSVLLLICRSI